MNGGYENRDKYNYLFCDWKVQLLPAKVPDLAGLEAGNLSPHGHHRGVPAHVRNVRSAASEECAFGVDVIKKDIQKLINLIVCTFFSFFSWGTLPCFSQLLYQ
jgi:hypothetical protein